MGLEESAIECGGAAAYPRHGSDSLLGVIDGEGFAVEPPNPDKICSVASVAAHSLYERSDPYRLALAGGAIDLTRTTFEQVTPRAVRVRGTRFMPAPYTFKLEGVHRAGYRLLFHVPGFLIEVVADDAETSAAIPALSGSAALHSTYPGRKVIAGNLAFPFSPSDVRTGEAFEFTIHHLVEVDDPLERFPVEMIDV